MSDVKIDWYGEDAMLLLENASAEILTRLAFYVEAEAKTRANVDTGFMRNAIYAVAPGVNNRVQAEATAHAAAEGRVMAGTPAIADDEAAVHGAASYTIDQEMRVGFMYGGLQAAQAVAPGIIAAVGREKL